MKVGECCTRKPVVATAATPIEEIARLMRERHVGAIVVVEKNGDGNRPIGLVTDRDLVVEVLAAGVSPAALTAGDLMGEQMLAACVDDDLDATLASMSELGVRRAPVVDAGGTLVGMLTLDDVLGIAAQSLNYMAQLVAREIAQEAQRRQ